MYYRGRNLIDGKLQMMDRIALNIQFESIIWDNWMAFRETVLLFAIV